MFQIRRRVPSVLSRLALFSKCGSRNPQEDHRQHNATAGFFLVFFLNLSDISAGQKAAKGVVGSCASTPPWCHQQKKPNTSCRTE